MIHDIGIVLALVKSPIARIDSVGIKRPLEDRGHRQRPDPVRERMRRQPEREPDEPEEGARDPDLPGQRLPLAGLHEPVGAPRPQERHHRVRAQDEGGPREGGRHELDPRPRDPDREGRAARARAGALCRERGALEAAQGRGGPRQERPRGRDRDHRADRAGDDGRTPLPAPGAAGRRDRPPRGRRRAFRGRARGPDGGRAARPPARRARRRARRPAPRRGRGAAPPRPDGAVGRRLRRRCSRNLSYFRALIDGDGPLDRASTARPRSASSTTRASTCGSRRRSGCGASARRAAGPCGRSTTSARRSGPRGPAGASTMARNLDALAVIFPFETECYADTGLPVEFVGHPFMAPDYAPAGAPRPGRPGAAPARKPRQGRGPDIPGAPRRLPGVRAAAGPAGAPWSFTRARRSARSSRPRRCRTGCGSSRPGRPSPRAPSSQAAGRCRCTAPWPGSPGRSPTAPIPFTYLAGRWLVRVPFLGIANILLGRADVPGVHPGRRLGRRPRAGARRPAWATRPAARPHAGPVGPPEGDAGPHRRATPRRTGSPGCCPDRAHGGAAWPRRLRRRARAAPAPAARGGGGARTCLQSPSARCASIALHLAISASRAERFLLRDPRQVVQVVEEHVLQVGRRRLDVARDGQVDEEERAGGPPPHRGGDRGRAEHRARGRGRADDDVVVARAASRARRKAPCRAPRPQATSAARSVLRPATARSAAPRLLKARAVPSPISPGPEDEDPGAGEAAEDVGRELDGDVRDAHPPGRDARCGCARAWPPGTPSGRRG